MYSLSAEQLEKLTGVAPGPYHGLKAEFRPGRKHLRHGERTGRPCRIKYSQGRPCGIKASGKTNVFHRIPQGRLLSTVAILLLLHAVCAQPALAQGGEILWKTRSIVKIIVDIVIGLAALLMALGFGVNFVRGMLSTLTGRPAALSDTWAAVIAIVICGGGAMLAIPIANVFIDTMAQYAGSPLDHRGFPELGQAASDILSIAIGMTALFAALGIAVSFLRGEISAVAGAPAILSEVWFRIMGIVICLLVAVLATTVSRMIVSILLSSGLI